MWDCRKAEMARHWKSQFCFLFCSLLSEKFGNEQMQLLQCLVRVFCAVMQHIKVDHEKKLEWEQLAAAWWAFPLERLKWQTLMLGEESAATWKELLTLLKPNIVVYLLYTSVSQQFKHVPQVTENTYTVIYISITTSWRYSDILE